jgi:hypothetical protein
MQGDSMHIHFERTGGFAGMRKVVSLDTESLLPEEGKTLQEMINAAGFFDLPAKFSAPKKGADYFQYSITVELEGKKHSVQVAETAVPDNLRPLIQYLIK